MTGQCKPQKLPLQPRQPRQQQQPQQQPQKRPQPQLQPQLQLQLQQSQPPPSLTNAAAASVIDAAAVTATAAVAAVTVTAAVAIGNSGGDSTGDGGVSEGSSKNTSSVAAIPLRKSQQWVIPSSSANDTSIISTSTILRTSTGQHPGSTTPSALSIRDQKIAEEDQHRAIALEGDLSNTHPLNHTPSQPHSLNHTPSQWHTLSILISQY